MYNFVNQMFYRKENCTILYYSVNHFFHLETANKLCASVPMMDNRAEQHII